MRASALGRALRRLAVESQGREVVLTLSLTNAQLDDLLALWRELRTARDEDGAPRERPAGDAGPAPDPTLVPPEPPAADAGAGAGAEPGAGEPPG
ncbi:MAG: hypothetical protein M5U28_32465 [Sandaracinaceae bacterium]|nr:hypothetical protein [Sandaracinaceae bacterium]